MSRSRRLPGLLALWSAVVIWASTFIVSKKGLEELGPGTLSTARFAIAAVLLISLVLIQGGHIGRVLTPQHAVLGLTGVALYFGLQNVGLEHTDASTAALLQALLPPLTAVLAGAWLRERPSGSQLIGLAVVVIGVLLVVGLGVPDAGIGELAIVFGIAAYAMYTVLLRSMAPDTDPLVVAAGSAVYGSFMLCPWLGWELMTHGVPVVTGGTLIPVLYLGVVASALTLYLWSAGVAAVTATTAGAFTGAIPALGYVFALAAGEGFDWAKTLGGTLAVLGVVWASQAESRQAFIERSAASAHPRSSLP